MPGDAEVVEPTSRLPETVPNGDEVLVDALNGIVLFDSTDELGSQPAAAGINTALLELPHKAQLASELAAFLGRPLTLNLLDELNREIIAFGRAHDRPVIDAFAPEGQDITAGVVQIIVVTAKRGDVRVEGVEGRTAARLRRQSGIAQGTLITAQGLRDEIEWLNQNPFRRINIVLERGERFGETDLIYAVTSGRPYRLYGGVEDTGTRLSGKERWFTGLNWGDVFGLGHQFNYQFTSSFDTRSVNAHSIAYVIPLTWRHTLEMYGVYVDSEPDVTGGGFGLQGKTWQTGFRYRIPLASLPWLRHQLEFGYDYKRSDNDLEFGTLRVSNTETVISQFSGTYEAGASDRFGSTSLSLNLTVSPGGMTGLNDDLAFAASRFGASADYVYTRASIVRFTFLPRGFSWFTELELQGSNENLLGSEQFAVGGYDSVRGYDNYEVPADIGLTIRNEIRTPAVGLLDRINAGVTDQFSVHVFTDYGLGRSKQQLPGESTAHLWSVGLGFRYNLNPYLDVRFDYGWQLKNLASSAVGSSRAHFGVVIAF